MKYLLILLLITSCATKNEAPKEIKIDPPVVVEEAPKIITPPIIVEEPTPVIIPPTPVVTPPRPIRKIRYTMGITSKWKQSYQDVLVNAISKEQTPNMWKYNSDIKWWLLFFKSLTASESAFNIKSMYWEDTLGVSCKSVWPKDRCKHFIKAWNKKEKKRKNPRYAKDNKKGWDKATKTFYLSEGLLQLSYSDNNYYGCDFDWNKDRYKNAEDGAKTIFDPKKNLECGVIIMERQIAKRFNVYSDSSYWLVLRSSRKQHENYLWYYNYHRKAYGY